MSTRYHQAAIDGYLDILKEATKKDVNTTDGDGMTPTLLAAYHGHLDVLELVCHRGGDANKSDIWGNTPLHHAAERGHANCVAFLINFGANIFAFDNEHHSPLDVAIMKGRTECVKILDEAANKQIALNSKKVSKLKEQALKEAEKRIKDCEKLQDKHENRMKKNFNKTGTVNSTKGTLSGANFSTPSTISTLTKGIKDTLQLKLRRKDKNTIDQNTVDNVIFSIDENSGGHRTKVTDVFNNDDDTALGEEEKQSIFNRPGLGNMIFKKNLTAGINTDFGDTTTAEDDLLAKVKSELFSTDNYNEDNNEDNTNIAWNDNHDMDIDEEDESSPLKVFLESCGLLELYVTLLREKLDLDSLLLCSSEDLQSINIQLGPRKKLLNAIDKRKRALDKPGEIIDTKL
ncbi:ankyrin repeat and SAM domain-containing protein 4B [Gastrophryne carolinensis]